ncbi:hypothetical protein AVEN_59888-1 [Araneus ventricosus]|uniref:Uncharacterized protein n=1 Tax=Araneus ventricosus TaxID=182803 RepID=A0A4Y2EF59_ARAVE|nr:hypothetical protein AVEN_59888-1 [Araneus ventricosus]
MRTSAGLSYSRIEITKVPVRSVSVASTSHVTRCLLHIATLHEQSIRIGKLSLAERFESTEEGQKLYPSFAINRPNSKTGRPFCDITDCAQIPRCVGLDAVNFSDFPPPNNPSVSRSALHPFEWAGTVWVLFLQAKSKCGPVSSESPFRWHPILDPKATLLFWVLPRNSKTDLIYRNLQAMSRRIMDLARYKLGQVD